MTTAFLDAVKVETAKATTNGHRPVPRTPVMAVLGRAVGRGLVRARALRSAGLQLAGFGLAIDCAYQWQGVVPALATAAVSCFALEYLINGDQAR
jgi:hypothetical protein